MTDQHKDHMQRKLTTSTTRNQVANKLTEAKEAIKSGTEKASGMFKHKGAEYVISRLRVDLKAVT
jgi:uncharacterized protein YdhG (YjbR/CyaY superfamily)